MVIRMEVHACDDNVSAESWVLSVVDTPFKYPFLPTLFIWSERDVCDEFISFSMGFWSLHPLFFFRFLFLLQFLQIPFLSFLLWSCGVSGSVRVRGPQIRFASCAWRLGNRHRPCQSMISSSLFSKCFFSWWFVWFCSFFVFSSVMRLPSFREFGAELFNSGEFDVFFCGFMWFWCEAFEFCAFDSLQNSICWFFFFYISCILFILWYNVDWFFMNLWFWSVFFCISSIQNWCDFVAFSGDDANFSNFGDSGVNLINFSFSFFSCFEERWLSFAGWFIFCDL